MILDINLDLVLKFVRFLSNHWVGIEIMFGRCLMVIEVLENLYFHLNVKYFFHKSALSTSKNLGKVDLRVDIVIFIFIYSSILRSY